jgi:hypothetical protein
MCGGRAMIPVETASYMRAWSGRARKSVCVRPATMPCSTRACDNPVPTLDAIRTAQSPRNADNYKREHHRLTAECLGTTTNRALPLLAVVEPIAVMTGSLLTSTLKNARHERNATVMRPARGGARGRKQ